MKVSVLERWEAEFVGFHGRFADLFVRSEPREEAAKYLRSLLSGAERKNGWQMSETVGEAIPDRMQRLLYRSEWDTDLARDRLRQFVVETLGDLEGVVVLDETGFLKKGERSVGVVRQSAARSARSRTERSVCS